MGVVRYGVPQGSVLGPLLFILYINDMPNAPNLKTLSYADDTSVICWDKLIYKLIEQIETGTGYLIDYFALNNLSCNVSKTKILSFNTTHKPTDYRVNVQLCNESIVASSYCKFLGIIVDSHLTWEKHIDLTCTKVSKGVFLLKYFSRFKNLYLLRVIYYGVIYPHLQYCIEVWGAAANTHVNRLLVLQKKCIRLMSNVGPRHHCKELFINQEILTVVSLYIYRVILLLQRSENIPKNSDIHDHNTRQTLDMYNHWHRRKFSEKDPLNIGTKFFNKLPVELKLMTGNKFKTKLKHYLIHRPLYRVDEF